MLAESSSSDQLSDPLALKEDVAVIGHGSLEGLVSRDLSLSLEEALEERGLVGDWRYVQVLHAYPSPLPWSSSCRVSPC